MRRLADVADEEDVVDTADPRPANTRVYRVRNVGSTRSEPQADDGVRGQLSRAVEALFQSDYRRTEESNAATMAMPAPPEAMSM
jgi:hypothetical protein